MQDRLKNTEEKEKNKSRGMEGNDKSPGEETPDTTEQFIAQTQKGKGKDDGDPSREEDAPLDRQDIE
jgi:hypothetical protein